MTRFGSMPLLLVVMLLLAVGCVPDTRPGSCDPQRVEIRASLSATALDPAGPAVCRDQEVTLVVDSEVDGVLHIHGYDSQVPAFTVRAGDVTDITFVAGRSGQFPIEFHAADDPRGVSVGIFTVHEP